jgi:hypothetical protein
MTGALQRLLDGVFDYAGLFPPAKQSMSGAVDSYLRHRQGPESALLDRFVCPSDRLEELRADLEGRSIKVAVPITVVSPADLDWGDRLVRDAEAMTRFVERAGELGDIEAFEARLPDLAGTPDYLRDLRAFNQIDVFCELPWGEGMTDALGQIAEAEWLGAKARTGGLDASAFPSSEELASFLQQCVQLELPFKLTAGLHHPFRSHRQEVGTKMHGFLNVLVATTMTHAHDLASKEAAAILESASPADFEFTDREIRYQDWRASLEDIDGARSLFVGIGSCSVEEPMQDLASHNL